MFSVWLLGVSVEIRLSTHLKLSASPTKLSAVIASDCEAFERVDISS